MGGGLAGLTAGIHLARHGITVGILEKKTFPHHKVCGEYLSKEVLPYLKQLGVNLNELQPKQIKKLKYSTSSGKSLQADLPLGGLGISRFALDNYLYENALAEGVEVIQEKAKKIFFSDGVFEVETSSEKYTSDYVLGAFGKRSLMDKSLQRDFFYESAPWVAVKTHYKAGFPDDLVALHNFQGGYCGLSKTENEEVNLCYLATYKSFKEHKDPEEFKEKVLRKNPFLDDFLSKSSEVFDHPLTIAQISFIRKEPVEEHVLMIGDTAGLIHPLCGNGMAMAIHSAKIAAEVLLNQLSQKTSRTSMEKEYKYLWNKAFRKRLNTGKWLQKVLLQDSLAEFSQGLISRAPFLLPQIIKRTHGSPF